MTTGLETLSPRFVPFSSLSENVFSSSRSRLPSWRNRSDNSMSIDLGEIPVEIRIVGWRKNWREKKRIYIYNRTLNFHFRIRSFEVCYWKIKCIRIRKNSKGEHGRISFWRRKMHVAFEMEHLKRTWNSFLNFKILL